MVGSTGLRAQHGRAVVRDRSNDSYEPLGNRRRMGEPGRVQEHQHAVADGVAQALVAVEQVVDESTGGCRRSVDVDQMQGAAGFENAPYLAQCAFLHVRPEVVEHEGGKDAVEGASRAGRHDRMRRRVASR